MLRQICQAVKMKNSFNPSFKTLMNSTTNSFSRPELIRKPFSMICVRVNKFIIGAGETLSEQV